jgi:hypothetical protein
MSFSKTTAGIRHAETRRGDTLQAIALREMGDAGGWADLANLNGLVAPWLVDDLALAGPGVLLAGQQTILIPDGAAPTSGVMDGESVYGTDVALIAGRLSGDASGGMATVTGVPNLTASLKRRIDTHGGALVRHPEYGCLAYLLIGTGGSLSSAQLAAAYVGRALNADPRVSKVQESKATLTGDTLAATAVVIAIDGKKLPVGTT